MQSGVATLSPRGLIETKSAGHEMTEPSSFHLMIVNIKIALLLCKVNLISKFPIRFFIRCHTWWMYAFVSWLLSTRNTSPLISMAIWSYLIGYSVIAISIIRLICIATITFFCFSFNSLVLWFFVSNYNFSFRKNYFPLQLSFKNHLLIR